MSDLYYNTVWRNGYEIHYLNSRHDIRPVDGEIFVYYPITRKAYVCHLYIKSDLANRASAQFNPHARRLSSSPWYSAYFFAVSGEIHIDRPTILADVIERLIETGGFEHIFKRCDLPEKRWDNLQMENVEICPELETYCFALSQKYLNGFAEAKRYRISEGLLQDSILEKTSHSSPAMYLEILRHPQIVQDFHITDYKSEVLIQPCSWTVYSAFLFAGYLAQTLSHGGAYSCSTLSEELKINEALELANDVFTQYKNYQNLQLHVCNLAWSNRHLDIFWDHTWIIVEKEKRELTVFMASDTD